MTTLSTRHLPSGETAVLSDGTRIGTMVRATRKVASPRGERPCVGFLIADLAGAEIAWGSTYRFAVQRVIHEIEDANPGGSGRAYLRTVKPFPWTQSLMAARGPSSASATPTSSQRAAARLTAVEVFPLPPFCMATASG